MNSSAVLRISLFGGQVLQVIANEQMITTEKAIAHRMGSAGLFSLTGFRIESRIVLGRVLKKSSENFACQSNRLNHIVVYTKYEADGN